MRNSFDNLMTPFYQARIEAMTREIKKLNSKIECLEAQIEVAQEFYFKNQ
tara:strand:+ start:1986 stop:2135 length:150 start_codon:yes stop_codon:yes gene_type:complete